MVNHGKIYNVVTYNQVSAQINAFIANQSLRQVRAEIPPPVWLPWLFTGLGVMEVGIGSLIFFVQVMTRMLRKRQ